MARKKKAALMSAHTARAWLVKLNDTARYVKLQHEDYSECFARWNAERFLWEYREGDDEDSWSVGTPWIDEANYKFSRDTDLDAGDRLPESDETFDDALEQFGCNASIVRNLIEHLDARYAKAKNTRARRK